MSQIVNHQDAVPSVLQAVYAPIEKELAGVEEILQRELRSEHAFVDEMVRHGCMLGGKRLRPALLLLAGKATGEVGSDHLVLAAVVEMIHTATLVHDDVLDEADMRRHLATVNSRWDNEASVLLGDYLFTHSFYLASTLESTLACRIIGKSTNIVCEGELRQIGSRANYALSEEEYLSIIEAKTAELCACCCRLGAEYAGADSQAVENLSDFGRELGIAFQIADDLLDVLGDESTTGKSLGTDLDKQKPTLPLIRTLQLVSDKERDELLSLLGSEDPNRRETLKEWFDRFDAIQYTRDKAHHYAQLARRRIDLLPESPSSQTLQMLTDFVVMRSQ